MPKPTWYLSAVAKHGPKESSLQNRIVLSVTLLGFVALSQNLPARSLMGTEFCIAPDGKDTNPGTRTRPFGTLERSRDAIRGLKKRGKPPTAPITVWLRAGTYHLADSFALTSEDSGTATAPVTYRAYASERAILSGGRAISGFQAVQNTAVLARLPEVARGRVLEADLRAQGISDFGRLRPRGFGREESPAALELFFRGRPMILARWPNDGWTKIAAVPAGQNSGRFTYEGDEPKRWTQANDIWLHGYWTWDWADSHEKIKSINAEAREIATEPPHGVYNYSAGKRYYAYNLLEELDQPGEYYLDRTSGILYFWPPETPRAGDAVVSLLEKPIVATDGVSYAKLVGLTFECTRGTAIQIKGGRDVQVAGCTLRNIGNSAIRVDGTINGSIVSCDIHDVGDSGVVLNSGDRQRLSAGHCSVLNNHIHDFSRWDRTYRPAVLVHGVGNKIAHNLIHDAPHSAILFHGNEHVMEFNEIHHVCMETSDAGAIYSGRDFSWRGNVIRYNYLHHLGAGDVRAIYLDDDLGDVRAYGNLLYRAHMGVCVGGGRENIIENNVFVECEPSVFLDARGLSWAKPTVDGFMRERLEAMSYRQPPYSVRYPQLLTLYDDDPGAPKYNVVRRNISFGGKWLRIVDPICKELTTFANNLVDVDPLFMDQARHDFRLKKSSPAFAMGFKPIPIERIGLYKDQYRQKLPDRSREQ